jgi:alkylation response protein AidB-like acyl-CoA dehydrogenase
MQRAPTVDELLSRAAELSARFAARADAHDRDGSFPFENVADMRAAGLHALPVPTRYGGAGAGAFATVRALELIGAGDASTALGLAMHLHVIGSLAEYDHWPAGKFEQLCRDVMAHGSLVNSVASEPELGSPSRGGLPRTTAREVDGGFVLNGRKSWVTFAPALGWFLTSAEHEGRVSVFGVKGGSPGIVLLDNWRDALSLRASGSCDIELHDVFVPRDWLLMAHVDWPVRKSGLPSARPTLAFAATYLGIAHAALDSVAAYCRERVPTALGKPIAELPHIQRNIGQMRAIVRPAQLALHDAARRWDADIEGRASMEPDLALAKHLSVNAAVQATDLALRTVGAAGLDRKLPLERLLRDARAGLMHPPQDEKAFEILGKATLAAVERVHG